MATEVKNINYFPIVTNFFDDEKIELVIADYGLEAAAIAIKLLCNVYDNCYYYRWNANRCKIFAHKSGTTFKADTVQEIIDKLLDLDFFSREMYDKYGILTSKGIQRRYFEITKRRKDKSVEHPEYLLVESNVKNSSIGEMYTEPQLNQENVCRNEQRKGKKKKGEERIENENKNNCTTTTPSACAREGEIFELNNSDNNPTETTPSNTETKSATNSYSVTEILANFRKEAEADNEWKESVYRMSGYDKGVFEELPKMLPYFEDHLISIAETGSIRTINDYKRRFLGWWRCVDFMNEEQLKAKTIMRRSSKQGRRRLDTNEDFEMMAARTAKLALEITNRGGDLC